MLLRSGRREPRNEDGAKFTDRHRLRLEVASVQHLAFPSGIAPTELGRQWQWEGQGPERQRIPKLC